MIYPIGRFKPGGISWLHANLYDEEVRDNFFDSIMAYLLHIYSDVTLFDVTWPLGIELRDVYNSLNERQKQTIEEIGNNTAQCFLNGVNGRDWNILYDAYT